MCLVLHTYYSLKLPMGYQTQVQPSLSFDISFIRLVCSLDEQEAVYPHKYMYIYVLLTGNDIRVECKNSPPTRKIVETHIPSQQQITALHKISVIFDICQHFKNNGNCKQTCDMPEFQKNPEHVLRVCRLVFKV